ncbi:MAG: hypothetical protein K8R59_04045 [Thermoanaerobaculales bacterium]|nr:hypothetical protein [Thermoanaerobaculales bacterium]
MPPRHTFEIQESQGVLEEETVAEVNEERIIEQLFPKGEKLGRVSGHLRHVPVAAVHDLISKVEIAGRAADRSDQVSLEMGRLFPVLHDGAEVREVAENVAESATMLDPLASLS